MKQHIMGNKSIWSPKKINELTSPTIMDMTIKLGQQGTTYMASSDGFQERYDGSFKANFTGQGQTAEAALQDLMKNVTKYYSSK